MEGYKIEQKEPEGWQKAFVVTWNGEPVAFFSYRDSAEYYVERDVMNRRQA